MTYRQKLSVEKPEMTGPDFIGGCLLCPVDYGYELPPKSCPPEFLDMPATVRCWNCWNREMKE